MHVSVSPFTSVVHRVRRAPSFGDTRCEEQVRRRTHTTRTLRRRTWKRQGSILWCQSFNPLRNIRCSQHALSRKDALSPFQSGRLGAATARDTRHGGGRSSSYSLRMASPKPIWPTYRLHIRPWTLLRQTVIALLRTGLRCRRASTGTTGGWQSTRQCTGTFRRHLTSPA